MKDLPFYFMLAFVVGHFLTSCGNSETETAAKFNRFNQDGNFWQEKNTRRWSSTTILQHIADNKKQSRAKPEICTPNT